MEKESVFRLLQNNETDPASAAAIGNNISQTSGANTTSSLLEKLREQEADLKIQIAQLNTQFGPSYPKVAQLNNQLTEIDTQTQAELRKVSSRLRGDYMIAFLVQIAILGVLLIKRRKSRRLALALAGFLVILIGLAIWLGGSELGNRLISIRSESSTEISGGTRLAIVKDSWRMWMARPLMGWGLGNFPEVYPQYRSFYTNLFVNQAHNDYIQLMGWMRQPRRRQNRFAFARHSRVDSQWTSRPSFTFYFNWPRADAAQG